MKAWKVKVEAGEEVAVYVLEAETLERAVARAMSKAAATWPSMMPGILRAVSVVEQNVKVIPSV